MFLWFIRTLHSIGVFHDQARGGHISSVSTIPRYGFKIFHFMGTNAPSQAECQIQPPTQCRIRSPWCLLHLTDLSFFLYLNWGVRTQNQTSLQTSYCFSAPYVGKTNCFIKMAKHSLNCPSLSELGSIIRRFPRAKKRQLWWDTGWAKWSSSVETVDEKPHHATDRTGLQKGWKVQRLTKATNATLSHVERRPKPKSVHISQPPGLAACQLMWSVLHLNQNKFQPCTCNLRQKNIFAPAM